VLAAVRRQHRRSVRSELARVRGPIALGQLESFDLGDAERFPTRRIREVVIERRYADKVAPFIRWSVNTTRHIRIEDRIPTLAAVLPPNLIGAHAISHLAGISELQPDLPYLWPWWRSRPASEPTASAQRERMRAGLCWALETGRHEELNAALKIRGARPLAGWHDIGARVAEVFAELRVRVGGSWRFVGREALVRALDRLGWTPEVGVRPQPSRSRR
jgi:hypothetical protein